MRPLTAIVADDELPARRRLEELLNRSRHCRLIGAFGDGATALEQVRRSSPDIAFLDVRMPGLNGVEIARLLDDAGPTEVVFVTAFEDHAPEAFELGAADYLVKPFDDERFERALERCRDRIRRRRMEEAGAAFQNLLKHPVTTERPDASLRMALDHRGKRVLVELGDLDWIRADDAYVRIHAGEQSYLLRETLAALDRKLPATEFCRIHRSIIVRLDRIRALESRGRGDWKAHLHDGTTLPVSRSYAGELEKRLGTI